MCGIYGYITKENTKLTRVQKDLRTRVALGLAIANADRGTDSTGMAIMDNKTITTYKKACDSTEFIKHKKVFTLLQSPHSILLGHTRYATTGKVIDSNAHPFTYGSITGIHNGMISNHASIGQYSVDSEAIFDLLSKKDIVSAYSDLQGSASVAWVNDTLPNTLHLVRHDNPLTIVKVNYLDTVFFSSEYYPLMGIVTAVMGNANGIFELKENTVYTISPILGIEKTKIQFKQSYDWDYDKYKDWTRDYPELGYKDLQDDDTAIVDHYSDTEMLSWTIENESCELCHKTLIGKAIFWHVYNLYAVCGSCGDKNHLFANTLDYKRYSKNEIAKIIMQV